ncbi:MAG TPA: hypothetical protein VGX76_00615 [Pirellulales bacterium]|nr:hypothetical protein [Pirellulales bacterium]
MHRCRQALEALRQSNPGIVIDDDPTWLERLVQRDLGRELLGVSNPQASRWPPGEGINLTFRMIAVRS